jgi:hypothetical protein
MRAMRPLSADHCTEPKLPHPKTAAAASCWLLPEKGDVY